MVKRSGQLSDQTQWSNELVKRSGQTQWSNPVVRHRGQASGQPPKLDSLRRGRAARRGRRMAGPARAGGESGRADRRGPGEAPPAQEPVDPFAQCCAPLPLPERARALATGGLLCRRIWVGGAGERSTGRAAVRRKGKEEEVLGGLPGAMRSIQGGGGGGGVPLPTQARRARQQRGGGGGAEPRDGRAARRGLGVTYPPPLAPDAGMRHGAPCRVVPPPPAYAFRDLPQARAAPPSRA